MNVSWYPEVLKKYAAFGGRAGREEFWVYALFNFLTVAVLYVVAIVSHATIFMVLYYLFSLAVLLPTLAVGVRRLHDVGKSGWYLLLELVPFGAIVLIVFWAQAGDPGPNAFGAQAPVKPGDLASPPMPPAATVATSVAGQATTARPAGQSEPEVCASCQAPLKPGAGFCSACGAAALVRRRHCTSCGTGLAEGARFCGECGAISPGVV